MSRHLVARKSGVHRAACFALYRALLRQKHELQLNENQQRLFHKPIRIVFRRNSKLQSPSQISAALQLGYRTREGLHDGVKRPHILNRILELALPPRTNARPEDLSSSPRTKSARGQQAPKRHVAPYPGATRVLDRPFQNLSGRRHVPVLVNANRVPFLRLKKPQSPFLNRIIRDIIATREARLQVATRLTDELGITEDEDEWDQILNEQFGSAHSGPQEDSWDCQVKQAIDKNHKSQVEAIQKRADMAAEMYAIVEKEKGLAEEEKLRIRDEKHKARKARRLARRGLTEPEIQDKLYPRNERNVEQEGPSETEGETAKIKEVGEKKSK